MSRIVASKADLDRLYSLAARHGITDRRLDGPFSGDVSIVIAGKTHAN